MLRSRLRHVLWIGGGSGAGKSTVAARLAAEHGLHLYDTDAVMSDHAGRTTPEQAPYLHEFIAMSMDERWVRRSPEVMFETFHWFRGEGFGLIVEDLLALPEGTRVIAEGFRLLPALVGPLLADPSRAVWLLPTQRFRSDAVNGRATPGSGFLHRTGDPERAGRNIAERDRLFVDRTRRETRRLGLAAVEVDTAMTEEDSVRRVSELFGL
ncbi:shikimate kinase [Glycomyces arizonensis]|uniref:shikimate kinase n=1 Tax=Glycomyces arizonensis TaxID=256035 RepID=UPI0004115299|nr:shikimate kinase [Glycomyces arizonensis]